MTGELPVVEQLFLAEDVALGEVPTVVDERPTTARTRWVGCHLQLTSEVCLPHLPVLW